MIIAGLANAASGLTLLARIVGARCQPVTQSTISAVTYSVYDLDAAASLGTGTFAVSAVVFNSLVLDCSWTADAVGYNFSATIPAATLPESAGGHRVQCDVKFVPASGEPFVQSWQFTLTQVYI